MKFKQGQYGLNDFYLTKQTRTITWNYSLPLTLQLTFEEMFANTEQNIITLFENLKTPTLNILNGLKQFYQSEQINEYDEMKNNILNIKNKNLVKNSFYLIDEFIRFTDYFIDKIVLNPPYIENKDVVTETFYDLQTIYLQSISLNTINKDIISFKKYEDYSFDKGPFYVYYGIFYIYQLIVKELEKAYNQINELKYTIPDNSLHKPQISCYD